MVTCDIMIPNMIQDADINDSGSNSCHGYVHVGVWYMYELCGEIVTIPCSMSIISISLSEFSTISHECKCSEPIVHNCNSVNFKVNIHLSLVKGNLHL